MKIKLSVREAMAAALLAEIDTGAGAPTMEFYTGQIPAMGAPIVDTLLGTVTLSDPSATQSNGVLTFGAITEDSEADATGNAGWARLLNGDGDEVAYFTVSDSTGTGDIKMNTVAIVAGGPIRVRSMVVSMGSYVPCAEDLHAWLSSGIPTNPHDFVLAEGGLSVDSAAPIALPSALNVQDCIVVPSLSTTGCMVMDAVSGYGAVFDGTQFGLAFLTYQDAPAGTAILNDDLDYMVVAKDIASQEITWADIVFWFPLRWDADNRQMACTVTQTGNILFVPPGIDPFGGAGTGLFEGASYLSVDCENFAGTEEWTLRFWYKPDLLNLNDLIYNSRSGAGTGLNGIDIYATLAATTESLGLLPPMSIDAGVWHYVVFVYRDNTLSRHVNGAFSGSATVDLGPHSSVATIGGSPSGNIGYLHGRLMDAVFATKAITDFTVPTEPFSPG